MNEDTAIKVENVYKNFRLPHEKVSSLKSFFTGLHKKRTKSYEVQHALKDISFEVKKGEFFGIVGRNGSGKSTLLKIIAEIYRPTKGTLQKSGKLVPFIELGVGFNPELTGRENVYLNGALLGFTTKEINELYDDIVAFAELEPFMDQKLKNYSSGMQVRLAFSVATRAKADILLIDEVLAVGDADFQAKCFTFFKELKRENTTIIFVSHDMNSVREYCDRAILIDNSEIIHKGSPAKVAAEYSKLFLSDEIGEARHKQDDRWGNGSAEIIKPSIKINEGAVEIGFGIKAHADIEDPILGYIITNEAGQQVCGTNSRMLGKKIEPMVTGKKYTGQFKIDNIFGDGEYEVTLAVLQNNGTVTCDWWVNPVQLVVKKSEHIPYVVDVPTTLSYKENA